MTRKEITELLKIPASNLSEWSKKDDNNWRKKVYYILRNINKNEAEKLIDMGDINKMSIDEMNKKISYFVEIE